MTYAALPTATAYNFLDCGASYHKQLGLYVLILTHRHDNRCVVNWVAWRVPTPVPNLLVFSLPVLVLRSASPHLGSGPRWRRQARGEPGRALETDVCAGPARAHQVEEQVGDTRHSNTVKRQSKQLNILPACRSIGTIGHTPATVCSVRQQPLSWAHSMRPYRPPVDPAGRKGKVPWRRTPCGTSAASWRRKRRHITRSAPASKNIWVRIVALCASRYLLALPR